MREVYAALDADMRLLVEYKFFESRLFTTPTSTIGGQVALLCQKLGPQATVLVDTGHHAQGVNIEHIVACLLDEELLGGFHFNCRKYADDDLTVGSLNGHEVFLIFQQIIQAMQDADAPQVARCAQSLSYMFDQSHNLKNKIEATIQSALFVQECWLKAILVDQAALKAAQLNQDVVAAEEILQDVWRSDVRPLLAQWRSERALPETPCKHSAIPITPKKPRPHAPRAMANSPPPEAINHDRSTSPRSPRCLNL